MRKATSTAAAVVAALALTLTACGGDDGDDSKGSGTSGKATAKSTEAADRADGQGAAKKRSTASAPAEKPGPSRTSGGKKPVPSRTSAAPGRTSGGSSPSTGGAGTSAKGVQGVWYLTVVGAGGKVASLNVNGTSATLSGPGLSCPGTISTNMAIRFTCKGETATGKAALGNGGRRLTFNWNDGSRDQFSRTKPTA